MSPVSLFEHVAIRNSIPLQYEKSSLHVRRRGAIGK